MIRRLRPLPSAADLAAMYPRPHDHHRYGRDHAERVEATIRLGEDSLDASERMMIADLSAGNGAIALALAPEGGIIHLGDMAGPVAGADVQYVGPIERTIDAIPHVDLFICSETLEHLDDPIGILGKIRAKADRLLLTTPVGCWEDDNPEHLWAWDRFDIGTIFRATGWESIAYDEVNGRLFGGPYVFGVWICQ